MKEIDKKEGVKWLQSLLQVRQEEAAPIIDKVSIAEATGKWEIKFEAFSEALEKLPLILEHLKATPKPEGTSMKELSLIQELEEKALEAYFESCKLSMEYLKEPNRFLQSTIVLKVALAKRFWESSAKESTAFLRRK